MLAVHRHWPHPDPRCCCRATAGHRRGAPPRLCGGHDGRRRGRGGAARRRHVGRHRCRHRPAVHQRGRGGGAAGVRAAVVVGGGAGRGGRRARPALRRGRGAGAAPGAALQHGGRHRRRGGQLCGGAGRDALCAALLDQGGARGHLRRGATRMLQACCTATCKATMWCPWDARPPGPRPLSSPATARSCSRTRRRRWPRACPHIGAWPPRRRPRRWRQPRRMPPRLDERPMAPSRTSALLTSPLMHPLVARSPSAILRP